MDGSAWVTELAMVLGGSDKPGAAEAASGYAARVPASYRDLTTPAEAAADLAELEALDRLVAQLPDPDPEIAPDAAVPGAAFGGPHRLVVRDWGETADGFRIRRFGYGGIELTGFLPVLESFGLVVVQAVPHRIAPPSRDGLATGSAAVHIDGTRSGEVHIDDITVRLDAAGTALTPRFVPEADGPRLVAALQALAEGDCDVDSLNRLVTVAGLEWREVTVLRTYLRYRRQGGSVLGWSALCDPLVEFPGVAKALVGYFLARFDPSSERGADGTPLGAGPARAACVAELDLVPGLDDDQVLRGYLGLVDATTRTNYYLRDPSGIPRREVVIKLDSAAVPELPSPRPKVETFVHGPTVEAVHLRAGLVARGGLRWSERPLDFRTEVLDLAFAQVKKNAVIVPTGAKGGFVCRTPEPGGGPSTGAAAPAGTPTSSGVSAAGVEDAYKRFIRALLDVTDNIVADRVVTPPAVVAHDGPDPYLVVAADKGTATFSDLANSISEAAGFWLGDAFASGGSHGYDHKAMGITARGAWVAVRRHFHQLGIDVQTDPITVVGVGDMSGDVFGNGMLQSGAIELVACFDHRHVFLDPEPDRQRAFAERSRLFGVSRSSWADYDRAAISDGGGVFPRDAKVVPLSAALRRVLATDAEELTPPALIRAILSAPVDLLWFGGIGTYIKAPDETDAQVGDHANDGVRITSDAVRARVIAEGANLGITQRARIRYSRRGGRINADFIDNAAGVATSDREVNLKILLALAADSGRLPPGERDGYLARSEDEVANAVLRQVDHSVAVLNRSAATSAVDLEAYEALIEALEADGRVDRATECLPDRAEMEVRLAAGAGLIRPELAVLLAYAKSDLVAAVEASPTVRQPAYLDAVVPYFPGPVRHAFGDLIPRHRLYPQLVATDVAGEIVDHMGIIWAHETAAELGRDLDDVAAACWAARRVTDAGTLWAELEELSLGLSAEAEAALHAVVAGAVGFLARSYLLASPHRAEAETAGDAELARSLGERVPPEIGVDEEALVALDVDRRVARRFLAAASRARVAEVGSISRTTGQPATRVADALVELGRATGVDRLIARIEQPPPSARRPRGRLASWAARACADDVRTWRARAVAGALRSPGPDPDQAVGEAVASWVEANRAGLDRAFALLPALDREATDPLAVTSLVLRRLDQVR